MSFTGNTSDTFFKSGFTNADQYVNPFYGIPVQYLPQNMDHMLEWANHFLLRFGFYGAALKRIANYFITQISIDCDDEESKEEYQDIFEKINWKEHLAESGLNLLAYGNSFLSINQGFNRFLICPQCGKVSLIDRVNDFKFDKGKYIYTCPGCAFKGAHKMIDKPNKDISNIHIKHWDVREIKVRSEDVTGKAEYFWEIPQLYKNKVSAKGDRFYAKNTPKVIYDTIFENKMVAFNRKNFLHLKMATPCSLKTDGKAVPLCIYLFDNFFMLKVLERFNEAICFEDINPFRVIAMDTGTNPSNPVLGNMNAGTWSAAVDKMIDDHRRDPGSYHKFPFPLQFQQLGGDGKNLAPVELMQLAQNNILNALNIPQEMYTMNLATQAVGPALRLFENSWSCIVDAYNTTLQHWGDVVCKIRGLAPAKFSLIESSFADDVERKSVIGQLVSSNSIARSEFLKLYNLDYKDQLRKKMEEDIAAQELQEEEQEKQQIKASQKASIFNQQGGQMGGAMMGGGPGAPPASPGDSVGSGVGSSPQDILAQSKEIAQQLQPMDGAARRTELQKIKTQNETMWSAVKGALQQMDADAKKKGLDDSKGGQQ
jgi:predicted RNA-binding Zn-ribbon protein involved in translation (DUF1610 family)